MKVNLTINDSSGLKEPLKIEGTGEYFVSMDSNTLNIIITPNQTTETAKTETA